MRKNLRDDKRENLQIALDTSIYKPTRIDQILYTRYPINLSFSLLSAALFSYYMYSIYIYTHFIIVFIHRRDSIVNKAALNMGFSQAAAAAAAVLQHFLSYYPLLYYYYYEAWDESVCLCVYMLYTVRFRFGKSDKTEV